MKKMGNRRPNTRSKNKRDKPEDNADATSEIFMKILANEAVTDEDINQLYMLWKPVCQGCRVNTKDNPNCFCGLIPAPNGSRKSGLWQKTSEIIQSLGPDPSHDLRVSSNTPAGLTNLGATCYANSILQCLYMNKAFREGVFLVEPEVLEKEPVLNNLARLFAQLHSSKMTIVDSAPFIQTLELDNGIQQDSHEFLTLLFSLLEQCLSRSKVSKARTVVRDLFRGGVSHVTRCLKCGNDSEASSKIEDFYGLELNVKGLKSLDDSLDDYLSVEELKGDNQYYCDECASRADAARSIKLRSLPRVLNLQLKRYVFLPNTTTKKKITSAFCFPAELNLAGRLSDTSDVELMYDLAAVLVHKGSAVNSGHYTAHIRDNNSGDWWEFDDEQVSNLGKQPFGSASNSAAKSSKSDPATSSSAIEVGNGTNGNCSEAKQMKGPNSNIVDPTRIYSSSDAYMLMYTRRPSKADSEGAVSDNSEQKLEIDGSEVSPEIDVPLPSHLLEYVDGLNLQYIDSCEQYKSKKEHELSSITNRRQEVRSIFSEAAVLSDERSYFWISSEWLRQWADSIAPPTIDNTSIQCLHDKVPITKINSMKRVSAGAWAMLHSKYGGGPTLTNGDYCVDCIFEASRSTVRANSYRDKRLIMKELAEVALSGEPLDGKLYYVSKPWLQHWVRRKNIDVPSDADSGPTASIRCPHGKLMPELAPGAKRVMVPEDLWDFIRETAMSVKPDDTLGCSTFSSDSEPCPSCNVELREAAVSEDCLREFKSKQRQNHEKLASGKSIALCQDAKYYLLPSSWLLKWRSYVTASGKNASSAELNPLSTVIDELLCKKHGKLLKRPPQLTWKRDLIFQKPAAADGLTVITEDDWSLFCEDWGHTEAECVIARIEIENAALDDIMNEDVSVSEDHTNMNGGTNMALTTTPVIGTFPEVCEECIGERESSELITKLNYTNEDVCVCLIRGKEPPKSVLEASNISDPCRRSSKRSRKATYGNSVNLKVSGSTSVYQLKMMIWESFGVVKENQILHKGSKVIADETACLADANIFPGDVLWVTDSKIHENRDIADELSVSNLDEQKVEEGFRGTLLTSSYSFQEASEACSN